MKTEFEFIRFDERHTLTYHTRPIWDCVNTRHGDKLGTVSWYQPWRQFVFEPANTYLADALLVFSAGCLRDIQDFIEAANREYKLTAKRMATR